jgi:hypothetical protein
MLKYQKLLKILLQDIRFSYFLIIYYGMHTEDFKNKYPIHVFIHVVFSLFLNDHSSNH